MSRTKVQYGDTSKIIKLPETYAALIEEIKNKYKDVNEVTSNTFKLQSELEDPKEIDDDDTYKSYLDQIKNIKEKDKIKLTIKLLENKPPDPIEQVVQKEGNPVNVNPDPKRNIAPQGNNSGNQPLLDLIKKTIKICTDETIKNISNQLSEATLTDCKSKFDKDKSMEKLVEEHYDDSYIHKGIYCTNCCKNTNLNGDKFELKCIKGPRFLCTECNCNLCFLCESLQNHNKTHSFIKINKGLENELELQQGYNNMFRENNIVVQDTIKVGDEHKIEVLVFNNGEKAWDAGSEKFFLFSIGDGESFLYGKKVVCNNPILPEKAWKTNIVINCTKKGNFTSKWRMFNHKGIPFGEVLYIHLKVSDK